MIVCQAKTVKKVIKKLRTQLDDFIKNEGKDIHFFKDKIAIDFVFYIKHDN